MTKPRVEAGRSLLHRFDQIGLCRILLLAAFTLLDVIVIRIFEPGSDWAPLWAAGQLVWSEPWRIYDFELISLLQSPFTGILSGRPYVYPPSAQLLIGPLAQLPFWASFIAFTLVAASLLWRVAAKEGIDLALLLLAPPIIMTAMAGQPSLLVAALVFSGLSLLGRADIRAGVVLALAASIKPQLLILAPFALVGGGHWRAIVAAAVTGLLAIGLSLALFGLETWFAWFGAMPQFQSLIVDFEPLIRNSVSPYAAAIRLGYGSPWIIVAAATIAIPVCLAVFARTRDVAMRSVALIGGRLLVSPYSMNYELALLAPAIFTRPARKVREAAIPLIWAASLFANAAVVGLIAVYAWMIMRLSSVHANVDSVADKLAMQNRVYIST